MKQQQTMTTTDVRKKQNRAKTHVADWHSLAGGFTINNIRKGVTEQKTDMCVLTYVRCMHVP